MKSDEIAIFDGGVGTELYERGFFINRPFEELNQTAHLDVIAVHKSYLEAGSKFITTNSFSLTDPQLKKFDIEKDLSALTEGALSNANQARVGFPDAKVIFSLGPTGEILEPLGPFSFEETKYVYQKSALAALNAQKNNPNLYRFDGFILETFTHLKELECALDGIQMAGNTLPIIASLSVKSNQKDVLEKFARFVEQRSDIAVVGVNCSEGPSDLFNSLVFLKARVSKPILIQPNAGTPRHLNGRYFYMTSPDYFGKFGKRLLEAGAWGIGGCCGTGPQHIRAMVSATRMVQAQKSAANSGGDHPKWVRVDLPVREVPAQELKSKILQDFKLKRKVISVELLPPKGTDTQKILSTIEKLNALGVRYFNIPDGARAQTRIGSLHASSFIQNRLNNKVTAIPHFTTRDRNLIGLQSDLLGASVQGIHDILLVTGDPPKLGNNKEATAVYDIDSIGLAYLANCLNHGHSPQGEDLGSRTSFGIGVASNPTAIDLAQEIKRWKYKIESGAHFAVTQPIFDPEKFLHWKDRIEEDYRPHLVGIWPLLSLRNAEFMANEVPGVSVPGWVIEQMEKANGDTTEALKRGIGIAERVMRALDTECEGFCISAPLGKAEVVHQLLSQLQ